MIKFLTTLNPLTLALRLGRGAAQRLFTVLKWKVILIATVVGAVALVMLAGIYTLTAPLDAAQQLSASLRGGAPNLPAGHRRCIPGSSAVIDGQYSPHAQQIISEIPPNATIAPATAYLLYRWSHQDQPWQPSWDEWATFLHDHDVTRTATDIDIAQTVDPQTDYTPYLVPARSTTIDLSIGGAVVADKRQIERLATQIYDDCRRSDEQLKTADNTTERPRG